MNFEDLQLAVGPYLRKLEGMQSADEIERFMMAEGVKAYKRSASSCAVAAYVRRESNVGVMAFYKAISAWTSELESSPGDAQRITLRCREVMTPTPAMKDFMLRFDKGEYPDLER
jgi:hypothetical protein